MGGSMKQQPEGIEIWNLDSTGLRCAVVVSGLVRYVGSPERCAQLARSLSPLDDRERQRIMLLRAIS